jgi:hypothetical protein
MLANRWRQAFAAGGRAALASRGAGGAKCELTPAQLHELEAGLAASGWDEDQCWTLARIADVLADRFTGITPSLVLTCCCTGSGGAYRCPAARLRNGMRRGSPYGGRRHGRW